MDEDKEKQFLPASVENRFFLRLGGLLSRSFYLILVAVCVSILGGITLSPYLSTKIVFLFELLLLTSIVLRNQNSVWLRLPMLVSTEAKLQFAGKESRGTDVRIVHNQIVPLLRSMLATKDLCVAAAVVTSSYVLAEIIQFFLVVGRSGGLANDVFLALCLSSLFPAAGAWAVRARSRSANLQSLPNLSYVFCYLGFTNFALLLSYLPHGLGAQFAGWLNACMVDANIADSPDPPFAFQLLVSTTLFITMMTVARPAMIRFSAGYQFFLKRAFVFKDSLLDAFRATVRINPIRVDMPDRHPHLRDACSTILWVGFIYTLLFVGVAFCPGALGETIREYYQSCIRDANLCGSVQSTPGLLTFIASIVAAYGTIPIAVMSCSFLSTKKSEYILASSEGILRPCDAKTFVGCPPLIQWENLERISLENASKKTKAYLKFSFDNASPLKMNISDIKPESLAALLNAADDYSRKCLIERPVLGLRKQLNDETKSQTMAQTKQFSSTVFSLLKAGDDLRGDYRIVRKLAGKSLSAVYLARNAGNELVVIKEFMLPENVETCDKLDADFTREYNALKDLQHSGIVKIVDFFEERNAKYLVIEHVAGTDMRELVNTNGPRSEASVRALGLSIASIMSYLHSREPAILHRDLTPDNLMISNDGNLKLIDFGASHQFIEGVTGTLIGKQCYIAPEQLRGKACVESDIYSFGCTLYFLLTGSDPKALQQSDPASDTRDVSLELRKVIRKCTEFEPQNRLHSFLEVIALLQRSTSNTMPALEQVNGN